jgi:enoyl-CoA hydratase
MTEEPEILCEIRGSAGYVVLNRPKALNALSHGMVRELARALEAWRHDPAVTRVVVTAAGEKAFCAGGDIRQIYEDGIAGRHAGLLTFWRDEYRLNLAIKTYPKPYLSLIDGIVMGGGVGISLHGGYRIAGERYLFAMPEVGIGFFPDVGATFALPRLPHGAGIWLALTGDRVGPAGALGFGLATHAVPSARFAELAHALTGHGGVDEILAAFAQHPGPQRHVADLETMAACFGQPGLAGVLAALDEAAARGSAFAARALATIRTKSPLSVAIAFEQMRRGISLDFAEAMRTEYRIVARVIHGTEFYEGVRAVIIDKDNAPHWAAARIEDVTPADVAAFFAPLGGAELALDQG